MRIIVLFEKSPILIQFITHPTQENNLRNTQTYFFIPIICQSCTIIKLRTRGGIVKIILQKKIEKEYLTRWIVLSHC